MLEAGLVPVGRVRLRRASARRQPFAGAGRRPVRDVARAEIRMRFEE
jgi:hypothetical protein